MWSFIGHARNDAAAIASGPVACIPQPFDRMTNPYTAPFMLDVEIRGAGQLLWRGVLRVALGQGASMMYDLSQIPDGCTANASPRGRTTISVEIMPGMRRSPPPGQDGRGVNVRAHWTYPAGTTCIDGAGREVRLESSVAVRADEWSEITGDEGLVVRIRPRGLRPLPPP